MKSIKIVLGCLLYAGFPLYTYGQCDDQDYVNDQDDCCEASDFFGKECNLVETISVVGYGCISPPWVRVYSDDFDGTKLDETFWSADYSPVHGLDGNGDPLFVTHKEWFTPDNVIVSDGLLRLKAVKDPLVNQSFDYWLNGNVESATSDFDFQTGGVRSRFHFSNRYGTKIRSRIKLDEANRARYTFWTYGPVWSLDPNHPRFAEIDIFEVYPQLCIQKDLFIQRQQMNTLGYLSNGLDTYNRWAIKHDNDEVFGCQNAVLPAHTLTDFNVYEVEYDMYGIRWRTGSSVNNLASLRYDNFYRNTLLQELNCANFDGTYHGILAQVTRIPTKVKQDLRFTFYVQFDKDGQGDGDYVTPKYQTMDYVEVYQEAPCLGDVVYNSFADLEIVDDVYNVRLIHNGEMNSVDFTGIPSQWGPIPRALKVIVTGELTINAGTNFDPGCYVDIEVNDAVSCGGSPWQLVKIDNGEEYWEQGASDPLTLPGEVILDSALRDLSPMIQPAEKDQVKLYPNPTEGTVHVVLPPHYNASGYFITDKNGKEVSKGSISNGHRYLDLNFVMLVAGSYSITFRNKAGEILNTLTFIKE